jgi:hypothetical protein
MRGSQSFRLDARLDERALTTIASPCRLILRLVPVDRVLVGDSEAAGAAHPTNSDHDRSDHAYPPGENSLCSAGEAIVVVRLVRTQRNGADVVIEVLTGNQNGRLDELLKPYARHTSDGAIAATGSSIGPHMRATNASASLDRASHSPLAVYGDPVLAGGTELALGRPGRHRRLLVGLGLAGLLVTASLALAPRGPSDRPLSTPVAAPPATTTNPATNEPRVSPADPLQRALAEGHPWTATCGTGDDFDTTTAVVTTDGQC